MTTKFELGKTYTTREGENATIICTDLKHPTHTMAARYTGIDGLEFVHALTHEGYIVSKVLGHRYDLILPKDPLDDLPIDAPVWVQFVKHGHWHPRHYAGKHDGKHWVWNDGCTSHSADGGRVLALEIRTTKPE